MSCVNFINYRAPKVSKPPPAKPFFNQSSLVIDFYKGHLSAMVDRVADSDYSFIMYYAPWDAESQAARQQFEIAAQYYQNEVKDIISTNLYIIVSRLPVMIKLYYCHFSALRCILRQSIAGIQDPSAGHSTTKFIVSQF